MAKYGMVEIDEGCTWYLPDDLAEQETPALVEAFDLTFNPPHPVDGGFGWRALGDIREVLGDELKARGAIERTDEGWRLVEQVA